MAKKLLEFYNCKMDRKKGKKLKSRYEEILNGFLLSDETVIENFGEFNVISPKIIISNDITSLYNIHTYNKITLGRLKTKIEKQLPLIKKLSTTFLLISKRTNKPVYILSFESFLNYYDFNEYFLPNSIKPLYYRTGLNMKLSKVKVKKSCCKTNKYNFVPYSTLRFDCNSAFYHEMILEKVKASCTFLNKF